MSVGRVTWKEGGPPVDGLLLGDGGALEIGSVVDRLGLTPNAGSGIGPTTAGPETVDWKAELMLPLFRLVGVADRTSCAPRCVVQVRNFDEPKQLAWNIGAPCSPKQVRTLPLPKHVTFWADAAAAHVKSVRAAANNWPH